MNLAPLVALAALLELAADAAPRQPAPAPGPAAERLLPPRTAPSPPPATSAPRLCPGGRAPVTDTLRLDRVPAADPMLAFPGDAPRSGGVVTPTAEPARPRPLRSPAPPGPCLGLLGGSAPRPR
jgi:hypothetical protein